MSKESRVQDLQSASGHIQQIEAELSVYKQSLEKSVEESLGNNGRLITSEGYPTRSGISPQHREGLSSQNIYEDSLHEQIKRATKKYTQKCRQYEKLHNKYTMIQEQLRLVQEYSNDVERERKFLAEKLSDIEIHAEGDQMVGELQNKLVLMSTEIIRLGNLSRSKTQEVSNINFKIKQLIKQIQNKDEELEEREKSISQFRQKMRHLQRKIYDMEVNKEYEGDTNYKILSQEVERLNRIVFMKNQEISSFQYKLQSLERQNSFRGSRVKGKDMVELQLEVQRYQKSHAMARDSLEEQEEKNRKLRRQKQSTREQNQRYLKQIKQLEADKQDYLEKLAKKDKNYQESIKIDIQYRQTIIQQQKEQISKLQNQQLARSQIQISNLTQKFQQQIGELRKQLSQTQQNADEIHHRLNKYEQKVALFAHEIGRLTYNNKMTDQEYHRIKQVMASKIQQLNQSQHLNRLLQTQNNDYKRQVQKLRKESEQMWIKSIELQRAANQLKYYKQEVEMMVNKLEDSKNYNIQLQQKIINMEQNMNSRNITEMEELLNQERLYFNEKQQQIINSYEVKIKDLETANNMLTQKLRTLAQQQSSTQNNYLVLVEEIQRLNRALYDNSENMLNQKRQITSLENNLQSAQSTLQKIKRTYIHPEKVDSLIEQRTQTYRQETQTKNIQLDKIRQSMSLLESAKLEAQRQTQFIKQHNSDLEQRINKKQSEVASLISELSILQSTHSQLLIMINDIRQSNQRLQTKIQNLTRQNQQMTEADRQARKSLQNQIALADKQLRNLNEKNSYLIEQNIKKQGEIRALRDKVEDERHKIEILQKQMAQADARFTNKAIQIQETIQQYERELQRYQRTNQSLENELKTTERQKEEGESEKRKLQMEIRVVQSDLKALKEANYYETKKQSQKNAELRGELKNKQFETDQYRSRIEELSKLIALKNTENQAITHEMQELKQKNKIQSQLLTKKQEAMLVLTRKLEMQSGFKPVLNQEKKKVQLLSNEVARLNLTLCQNIEQLNQLQNLSKNYQSQIDQKNKSLNELSHKYRLQLGTKMQEIDGIMRQQGQLNKKVQILERKLVDERNQYHKELKEYKQQIKNLSSEKSQMLRSLTDQKREISRLQQLMEDLEVQKYSYEGRSQLRNKQIEDNKAYYQKKISLLISENQGLSYQINVAKKELRERENELNAAQRGLNKAQEQKNDLQSSLQREKVRWNHIEKDLKQQIQDVVSNRQRDSTKSFTQQKINRLHAIIKDYEAKIALMSQQIERLNLMISNYDNTKNKQAESHAGILQSNYDTACKKISEYQFKISKLKEEFELLNRLAHDYKEQNEILRSKNHSKCIFIGQFQGSQAISIPTDSAQRPSSSSSQRLIRQTLNSEIDRLNLLNKSLKNQMNDLKEYYKNIEWEKEVQMDPIRFKGGQRVLKGRQKQD